MSDRETYRADLARLAELHGVQRSYTGFTGKRRTTSREALVGVLAALGVEADTPARAARARRASEAGADGRMLEPVLVAWNGRLDAVTLRLPGGRVPRHVRVTTRPEDPESDVLTTRVEPRVIGPGSPDGVVEVELAVEMRLALGYHRLHVEAGRRGAEAHVVAAPRRVPGPRRGAWGVFVPLLGLGRAGAGTYTDLERLHAWLAELGGGVLATLPMLAAFLDEPYEPSPYSPASRLFWNELFVDPARVPGAGGGASRRGPTGDAVDPRAEMARVRARLEPVAEAAFAGPMPEGLRRFLHRRPEVRDYARFRAEVERRRQWWGAWPPSAREGRLRGDALADPVGRYHVVAQWLAHEQLETAADRAREAGGGLYLDLPLGVNGAGYDVWRHRETFATGACAGAPPDALFTGGQAWGFPPPDPVGTRESGYAYQVACLRHALRSAAILRIDHVMGMHRLWWVPDGLDATEGAYVRYRPEEWYAIVALEAGRAGAVVVGEDLGTVPASVRQAMGRHGLLSSYVVQYEAHRDAPVLRPPPAGSLASVNTHDMPTWAGYWAGDDLRLAEERGWLVGDDLADATANRQAIRERLHAFAGVAEGHDEPEAVLDALLRWLAGGPAAVVVAALEDLWLERRPVNVPGTTHAERPNWRRRVARSVGQVVGDPAIAERLRTLAALREAAA